MDDFLHQRKKELFHSTGICCNLQEIAFLEGLPKVKETSYQSGPV